MTRARHRPQKVDEELLKTLPAVLRAVVRALGFDRASAWLKDYGGVNVYIPISTSIALKLNANELQRLRATLAPHMDAAGRCWLPKVDKLYLRVRDAQIRKDLQNESISLLARRYRLSSRQILNIGRVSDEARKVISVCSEGDDSGQLDLF